MTSLSQLAQLVGFVLILVSSVIAYSAGVFGNVEPLAFVVALCCAVSIYLAVFRIMDLTLPGKPKARRIDAEAAPMIMTRQVTLEEDDRMLRVRRARVLAAAVNSKKGTQEHQMLLLLHRAGRPGRRALAFYSSVKAVAPAVGAGLGALIGLANTTNLIMVTLAVGSFALVALMSVDWILRFRANARLQAIDDSFPDVIELIMIGVANGMSIDITLDRVVSELRQKDRHMRDELRILINDLRVFETRAEAYDLFMERLNIPSLIAFSSMIKQSEAYGTSISQSLKDLAEDGRKQRIYNAEKKAARIPVLSLFPLAFFILPSLFIIILAPAIISVVNTLSNLNTGNNRPNEQKVSRIELAIPQFSPQPPDFVISTGPLRVANLAGPVDVSIEGEGQPQMRIAGSQQSVSNGQLRPDQTLEVRMRTPPRADGSTHVARLKIGDLQREIRVRTRDEQPEAFTVPAIAAATPGSITQAAIPAPRGFDVPVALRVTSAQGGNPEVSVDGGPWASTVTLSPNSQSVRIRVTSDPLPGGTRNVTIFAGIQTTVWTVTSGGAGQR